MAEFTDGLTQCPQREIQARSVASAARWASVVKLPAVPICRNVTLGISTRNSIFLSQPCHLALLRRRQAVDMTFLHDNFLP